MSGDPIIFSYSKIATYNECGWHYDLAWNQGYEARRPKEPMKLGDAVHFAISEHLREQRDMDESLAEWLTEAEKLIPQEPQQIYDDCMEMLERIVAKSRQIAARTIDFLGDDWQTEYIQGEEGLIPMIETEVEIPLFTWKGRDILFQAHLDWVARERVSNSLWLLDHKVKKTLGKEQGETTRLQMAIYQYLLMVGWNIETIGSATIQMRDDIPHIPKINKNGSISRTKITTDWATYRRTILEAGGNPADYADIYRSLQDVEFVRVVRAFRSKKEIVATWNKVVIPTIMEILDSPRYRRSLGSLYCGQCEMREPCLEDIRGQDIGYLLDNLYRNKQVPTEEEMEEFIAL